MNIYMSPNIEQLNEFDKYKKEINESIDRVKEKLDNEIKTRKYINFDSYSWKILKDEISESVKITLNIKDVDDIILTIPPTHIKSDFALELFDLAKKVGMEPNLIAKKISENINGQKMLIVKNSSISGPFVNIEANENILYKDIISQILELGQRYGESDVNAGKIAIIDYSAPNIAKPIGVGHLRSTIIGQAISNIYHETGYSVIGDNHLGDWGTQFGSLVYAYKEWGDEKKIKENPINELKNLYVKFHKYSEDHPEIKDKARELFMLLEKKDPELIALWKRFRDLSLDDFDRVYKRLGIKFDTSIGESFFIEETEKLVDDCLKKGFCRIDEATGAVIVDQIGEIPSFLLRKQDGSSLYLARDLATILFRIKTFKPDSILYVVGDEQDLNFKQLFEFGKRAGYIPNYLTVKHISFGMVLRDGKKMSTRRGTLIELEELIYQSIEKSKEVLLEKNPGINSLDLNKISEIVGIGAIIYNDLRQSRTKSISFDWNKMLDFECGSAVYLQYTYVRIISILNKVKDTFKKVNLHDLKKEEICFVNKSEFDLAKKLMVFPEIIIKVQKNDSPHYLCTYLEELALLFNSFYNEVSIMKTDNEKLRDSRMALCENVALVIKKGLLLLSIKVPERM